MLEQKKNYANAVIDGESSVHLNLDLDKAKLYGNGNSTVIFQVKEFFGESNAVRSITTYSIILEVKGLKTFSYQPEVDLQKDVEKIRPKMTLEKVDRLGLVEISFN